MNWTIHNDLQSVTVGINARMRLCRLQKIVPTLIRLGPLHSILFWKERWVPYVPTGGPPKNGAGQEIPILSGDVAWDRERSCWCWTFQKRLIPMIFNDPKLYGIAVDGVPCNPKAEHETT